MKAYKLLLLFCGISAISGCLVNRQRQVWLGALQQTHRADTGRVVRVYFDKQGNLYPGRNSFIPYKNFFDPVTAIKTNPEKLRAGNLEDFYINNHQHLYELAAAYQLKGAGIHTAKDSFYAVQAIVRNEYLAYFNDRQKTTGSQTLVVLIHGFNDPDPTGDYQRMREAIRKYNYEKENFIYLEVFWDGLTANQGNPVFEGIWMRALKNSAYAALGLRKILSSLPSSMQIRIITHSLGAGVGTGALFNTETKWRQRGFKKNGRRLEKDYGENYYDLLKNTPAPKQDIRIGMIAPAIPGFNTFIDFNKRSPDVNPAENTIRKVVVGYNVNDYAVTKRFLKTDLARYFGSTSLGCNKERKGKTELERTETILMKNGYPAETVKTLLRPVNFSLHSRGKKDEEHGLYYYLRNTEKVKDFLKEMFE